MAKNWTRKEWEAARDRMAENLKTGRDRLAKGTAETRQWLEENPPPVGSEEWKRYYRR
nr:hypothetical protein [Micromonospora sp. DSM 115978]